MASEAASSGQSDNDATDATADANVRVYSRALYDDLVADANEEELATTQFKSTTTRSLRSRAVAAVGGEEKATRRRSKTVQSEAHKVEASKKRLQKYWEEAQRLKSEQASMLASKRERQKMEDAQSFQTMLDVMDRDTALVDDIQQYLTLKQQTDFRRREQLYKQWYSKVFKPIQKQIQRGLDNRSVREIEQRRREMFEEFLSISNKKHGLFRDIIIDDYDPLKHRSSAIRYGTQKVRDPIKRDLDKIAYETQIIAALNPNAQLIRPQNREVLDICMWNKLDATPAGRYAHMFDESKQTNSQNANRIRKVNMARTTLTLDHYNVDTNPALASQQYFPNAKKAMPDRYRRPYSIISNNDVAPSSSSTAAAATAADIGSSATVALPAIRAATAPVTAVAAEESPSL